MGGSWEIGAFPRDQISFNRTFSTYCACVAFSFSNKLKSWKLLGSFHSYLFQNTLVKKEENHQYSVFNYEENSTNSADIEQIKWSLYWLAKTVFGHLKTEKVRLLVSVEESIPRTLVDPTRVLERSAEIKPGKEINESVSFIIISSSAP